MAASPRVSRLRPAVGLALVVLVAWAAMQAVERSTDRSAALDAARARPGDIHMIASIGCVYCAKARAWFEAHRVPFSECLIERDADCAATYRALQAPGTPVLLVRGKRLVGFDARAVAEAMSGPADRPSSPN